jgi:hypothetical protein
MYHSVTFGSMNSFSDWHLAPEGRPLVVMPERKEVVVDIPGANGSLDLSESLTKYPVYQRRDGSIQFHVLDSNDSWIDRYTDISNYLHGQRRTMILEDDPDWHYEGVFKTTWTSNNDGTGSTIEIGYLLDPLKICNQTNIEESLSNTSVSNLSVNSTLKTITLINNDKKTMPVVATIAITSLTGTLTLTFANPELEITNRVETFGTTGTYTLYSFPISNMSGTNRPTLKFVTTSSTASKCTVTFRRARL